LKSFTLKYLFVNLLIFLLFCCYLIFIAMLFLNKNSNKTIAHKKEYFIQKIEITPKRLQIGIHNVNKSGLKI
jgi:hypothetical protein